METFLVLTVGSKEYHLALPTKWITEAEKKLGMSLLAAMDQVDRVAVIVTVLWASMQKLEHGMSYEKACELVDSMILDGGCEFGGVVYDDFSIVVRTKLYTQLMVISGFFTREQSEEILSKMKET